MFRIVARLKRSARTNSSEIALDQRDPCAFHRYIGAGAHCDSNLSLRESGRIIDPVARHGYLTAFRLQSLDDRALLIRQCVRMHFINPECSGYDLCGPPIISREHDDTENLTREQPRVRIRPVLQAYYRFSAGAPAAPAQPA
jgi:hypothetical protein